MDAMKVEPNSPVTAPAGAVANVTSTTSSSGNNSIDKVSVPAIQNNVAVSMNQTENRARNISATSGVVARNTDNQQNVNQTTITATVPALKSNTAVDPVFGGDSSVTKPSIQTLVLPGQATEKPSLSGSAGLPVEEGEEDPVLDGTIVEPIQPLDNSTRVNIVSQTQSNQTTDRQAGTA